MSSSVTDQPASASSSALLSNDALFNSKKMEGRSGGQSFLQALTETAHHTPKEEENSAVYVHPLVRKSSAKLSEKSLEMCTESLGSETGSDIMEDDLVNSSSVHVRKSKVVMRTKRENNFPPPLTSVNGSVSMKTRRESGRLIMSAVVVTESFDSLFHAERVDGRLTLKFKKAGLEEGDGIKEKKFEAEDEVEAEDGWEEETEQEELNGNDENVEGNFGIDENISRMLRCNDGGEERMSGKGHLWNMETCWVAT